MKFPIENSLRSSLRDCQAALKIQPNYIKALNRAAQCCQKMNKLELCIAYCDKILAIGKSEEYSKLRSDSFEIFEKQRKQKQLEERDERKREKIVGKLHRAIEERGITLKHGKGYIS